jgi:hypothetical protein
LLARDDAHRRAMASDDPAVLKSFLKSYPTGSRADEVRERLLRLEPQKAEDPPKPPKPDAARGFSKKKLMIAAAIAVIVIIGIYALSSSNSSSNSYSYTPAQQTSTPVPEPNYSATAQCSSKGIVGDGTGDTEEEAEDDAVNDCVANGGTHGCCRVVR